MKRETIKVKITNKQTGDVLHPEGEKRVLTATDVVRVMDVRSEAIEWDDLPDKAAIITTDEFTADEIRKLVNYAEDLKVRAAVRTKNDPNKSVGVMEKQMVVMGNKERLGITLEDFQAAITNGTVKDWVNRHYTRLQELDRQKYEDNDSETSE